MTAPVGSPQHVAVATIAGALAAYRAEKGGIATAEDFKAIGNRLYNLGFRQVGTAIDDHQNKRIEDLERAVDRLMGWVGAVRT